MRALLSLFYAILLLTAAEAYSGDNPSYVGGVLTLPSVDTADQVGQYQDVTFQLTPQGTWALSNVQVLNTGNIYQVRVINNVEVVKTGTLPVAVYLRVSGINTSCDGTGPALFHQRLQGTRFDVDFSSPHLAPFASGAVHCGFSVASFKQTVALDVYGLSAGTYSYSVNGVTGTFTLDSDNRFPDDCDVIRSGACP